MTRLVGMKKREVIKNKVGKFGLKFERINEVEKLLLKFVFIIFTICIDGIETEF